MVSIWGAEVKAFFCTVPCLDPPAISTMMESEGGEEILRWASSFLLSSPFSSHLLEARSKGDSAVQKYCPGTTSQQFAKLRMKN